MLDLFCLNDLMDDVVAQCSKYFLICHCVLADNFRRSEKIRNK